MKNNYRLVVIVEGATSCSEICSVCCCGSGQHGQHTIVSTKVIFLFH